MAVQVNEGKALVMVEAAELNRASLPIFVHSITIFELDARSRFPAIRTSTLGF